MGRKKQNTGGDMGHHTTSINHKVEKDIELGKVIEVQVLEENYSRPRIYGEETHAGRFNTNSNIFEMREPSKIYIMNNGDPESNKTKLLKKSEVGVLSAEVSECHGTHGKIIITENEENYEPEPIGQ